MHFNQRRFFSDRYPQEPPVVYLSESLVRTEIPSQEVFKYQLQNPTEFLQNGNCNIVGLLERVQSDVMKKITNKGYDVY